MREVIDDEDSGTLYLVLDYVEKGQVMHFDNETHVYNKGEGVGPLDEQKAKKYFRDLVHGMEYLHTHLVVHRLAGHTCIYN